MLQQTDEKHEEAHRRLRSDQRDLDSDQQTLKAEVAALKLALAQQMTTITTQQAAPIDVGKLMMNPKMVLGVVGLVVSIITGNYFGSIWAVNPLKLQVDTLAGSLVRIDERSSGTKDSVDELKRQMEARRLEIQNISNDLQQLKRTLR
jgi:chromosome segregation ATPase